MSGIEPITVYHFDDERFRAHAYTYYPDEVLNEIARRVGDNLDHEVLARLGYVKPVRCRDCELFNDYHGKCHRPAFIIDAHGNLYFQGEGLMSATDADPDGFCAWGKRREESE